ncbi:beta-N-acetylhexosaminidase [Enterovibrio makurazakiensis]|uniref:beta-N-acetylhexosaminidase n=1 Tax=Enterovibrio gelatinilyticus TaxID=2899819 RepID=A0ABT5R1P2_9GAMM|nr:beta-N-acetylhexosaminidase [Enterovibrio sp. ZSDZ42]MDD1794197.1 beta-N-acetylhexosaminidase [Enterovibrio sp. ZSDZ42]
MNFRLDLNVIDVQPNESRFALVLHNLSEYNIENWQLTFSVSRYVIPTSVSHGTLKQVGSLCVFETGAPLNANDHLYLEFSHTTKPFTMHDEGIGDACLMITTDQGITATPVETTLINLGVQSPERTPLTLPEPKAINLIPQPKALVVTQGQFALTDECAVVSDSDASQLAATWLAQELSAHLRSDVTVKKNGEIRLKQDTKLAPSHYRVSVKPQGITISASDECGFSHGVATVLQLIPTQVSHRHHAAYTLPCVEIEDHPRFGYRSMMLDCARHFHPVRRVKDLINQLARYKFNHFHWHLTDDEGWRIQIDAFPELTEIGAWRGPFETLEPQYTSLSKIHGGFYTKDEIRDVVAYAAQRGITVIPEIDIPGHCRAAIKSLPHMLVEDADASAYRSIQNYTDNVLNPGLKGTYTFLETVLAEVCELFPGPFVHIGADEVPENVWTDSPSCQALMKACGYTDTKELQGHILRHAENFLSTKGKQMFGWEEAVFGDKVSKDTVIFSWVSEQSGIECIRNGYNVVLQPGQETYLDMAQDFSTDEPGTDWACKVPLEKAYHYEPFANSDVTPSEFEKIKGIQCALWCEVTNTQSRFEYMIFPRLLAIAEVCWSAKEQRDWADFQARLSGQLQYLDRLGINYRR